MRLHYWQIKGSCEKIFFSKTVGDDTAGVDGRPISRLKGDIILG